MTTAFAGEATFVHDRADLSADDIARGTGTAPSTARAWLAGTRGPSGDRALRLAALSSIVERALAVMPHDYVRVWLNKPLEALGEDTPLEAIAAGRHREVARIISAIEGPIAA